MANTSTAPTADSRRPSVDNAGNDYLVGRITGRDDGDDSPNGVAAVELRAVRVDASSLPRHRRRRRPRPRRRRLSISTAHNGKCKLLCLIDHDSC